MKYNAEVVGTKICAEFMPTTSTNSPSRKKKRQGHMLRSRSITLTPFAFSKAGTIVTKNTIEHTTCQRLEQNIFYVCLKPSWQRQWVQRKRKGQVPKIQRQPKTKITESKIKRKIKKQRKREPNSNSKWIALWLPTLFADLILSKLMPHSLFNDIVLYYRS